MSFRVFEVRYFSVNSKTYTKYTFSPSLHFRYSCIKGYEVETAGSWDRDAEFKIFTNISQEKRCLKTDLRKGQCDVMEVLWYFNNKMLGMDTMSKEEYLPLGKKCYSLI